MVIKKIYDVNYSWKAFELKKDEITVGAYYEYLKLKAIIERKEDNANRNGKVEKKSQNI